MSDSVKIEAIVNFIAKHPQSTVSLRICRETLGEARERVDQEFAADLTANLTTSGTSRIDSYYCLIR